MATLFVGYKLTEMHCQDVGLLHCLPLPFYNYIKTLI